jgi:hypothetical protein
MTCPEDQPGSAGVVAKVPRCRLKAEGKPDVLVLAKSWAASDHGPILARTAPRPQRRALVAPVIENDGNL